ncbi:formyl-CoA transferase [Sphingomonas sp. Root710]|uniref:CaiB/BaiF CoA transferase family protein n=1 Tax=Sphingomonas sp. Root710 TaxID=1736594 RepID=UPI0006FCFC4D|nr:CoA transferase [Sphingomonas sp. Root710]KRB85528.1 formyl-CoA transferase [Sphingomonas sp. Root710]
MGPLAGIRVLDFGRYVAGPYCAALLADFGAEVIRIEKKEGNEDRYITPVTADGEGSIFLQMNRNKQSLALDVGSESGRAIIRQLIATADVVVANMSAKAAAKLGLDYASLTELKPDIIAVGISAFGSTGPWAERLGFDSIGQVMSGGVYLTGTEDQPYRSATPWVDFGTALHAAFAVMVALYERERSGVGQEISASLLATAVTFNGQPLLEQALAAPDRRPLGNRAFNSGPTDLFRTKDGWIATHVVSKPLFARWARLMGEEEQWLTDPRFSDDISRGLNGELLSQRMSEWCAERSRDEALDALAAANIPAGPVLSPQEVVDHPQVKALDLLRPVTYPGLTKPAELTAAPALLSRTPSETRAPPMLGEHTNFILESLGYDPEAISRLRQDGVI